MFDIFNKLLIIDSSYAMYRAFYGYSSENFRTKDGRANNCIYGVTKTITALKKQFDPSHLVLATDLGKTAYRNEILPQYKEGRTATPDDLKAQRKPVDEMYSLANIAIAEHKEYEADDIIATLAKKASESDFDVLIFSSDRDMFQLINDRVQIVRPCQGKSGFEIVDERYIKDKYGVSVERYPEIAALVGEGADNIPGVPGVGPKTATKWLQEFGSLDNLLQNAPNIPGKVGQALRDNVDIVLRNRKLNSLIDTVDLGIDLDNLSIRNPQRDKLDQFYRDWETPSLVGSL